MAEANPVGIGILGCGKISKQYFLGIANYHNLRAVACADPRMESARERGEEFGVPAVTVEELLAHPEVEIVVALTPPAVHVQVCTQILEAGKHAYTEKPLGLSVEEVAPLLKLARDKGLRLGCAPDTVLGEGVQTCRALIEAGRIGRPLSATAFLANGGVWRWHPGAWYYYAPGGGPVFDMAPYYFSALVTLLGPLGRVCSLGTRAHETLVQQEGDRAGETFPVEVDTHLSALIETADGLPVTTLFSFDVPGGHHLPNIEIYGTEASLRVPDPNNFTGEVLFRPAYAGQEPWAEVEKTHRHGGRRGLGVADMAAAIRSGRPHRASETLAHHVLETMEKTLASARSRQWLDIDSTCEKPAAMPTGLGEDGIDP